MALTGLDPVTDVQGRRTQAELVFLRGGIERLLASGDLRLVTLGQGAEAAADWVSGVKHWAPILDVRRPNPDREIVGDALHDARLVETGVIGLPGGRRSDAGRIFARGVIEVLDWWAEPTGSAPMWASPGAGARIVLEVEIGDVGADPDTFRWQLSGSTFPNG